MTDLPASKPKETFAFGNHDGKDLVCDLFQPTTTGPHPAVILVHGGGWDRAFKSSLAGWGALIARSGYVAMSVERRCFNAHEPAFPSVVQDVVAAVRYLRAEAPRHDVDPGRIGLLGASSGAYLTSLAALAGGRFAEKLERRDTDWRVKAVVGVYGVYDLFNEWRFEQFARPDDRVTEKLFGVPLYRNRQIYFEASPISYAIEENNTTSFMIVYGDTDNVVEPKLHSLPFAEALMQANFFVRTLCLPGANHYWMSDPLDEPGSYTAFLAPHLLRFLAARL
jgi:acetyl esterase/lipase